MDYFQVTQHCLELIRKYLQIFITQVYINKYGQDNYKVYLDNNTLSNSNPSYMSDVSSSNFTKYDDALYYMNLFLNNFNTLSTALSSNYAVTLIHSLRFFRNRIAHQAPLSLRMVYRFVDETQCLLEELNVGQNDITTLDMVRKELMKQMLNCNDNISVIGKNRYNAFEEVNVDMKIDNDYNMQSYENNNQYKEKIEQNYNKIVNGKDNGNFYKVKVLGEEEDNKNQINNNNYFNSNINNGQNNFNFFG